jgi:hypothetical protein
MGRPSVFPFSNQRRKNPELSELTDAEKEMNLQALKENYNDHIVYDPLIPIENQFNTLNPDAQDGDESEDNLMRKFPGKKSQPARGTSNEVRQTKSNIL